MEFVQPIRDKKKIDSMKKILKSTSLRDHCLFTLGINSGLRIGDLLKFKIADVLDERGKVKERIQLREKKTNKTRDFPLGSQSTKAIHDYLDERKNYLYSDPLFVSRKTIEGEPAAMQRDQAYKVINAAARAVGISEKIGTHTMRKTFGYHLFQKGVDVTKIQKLLNHSAPSVTLAYIGITQDELDDVVISLDL
jgi:site-specific recombinase XerD